MGRLPGDAHLAGGHRRPRHPRRLRHSRPRLRPADRRRRLGPLASRSQAARLRLMLHLYLVPLIFALIGLAFYTVLGGADFGAGFWQLTAGKGPQAQAVREHAHAAMAPVWEANHVWL